MNKFIAPESIGIKTTSNLASPRTYVRTKKTQKPPVNPFEPIGVGKPLVIRFHTLHVGDLKNGIFNNKQAVLVTSVIKDDVTYEVPPRGVHQIFNHIKDRQTLYPTAANEGTELIYYSKAFDSGRLKFDIEVKADRFNQDVIDDISNTLGSAAGLPVFAPYAPFILAGSQLLKVGGDIINKAIDKVPLLSFPFDISDDIGGIRDTTSGYLIGGNPDELYLFKGYKIVEDKNSKGNVYLAKNGRKYTGNIPYIIVSIDGRSHQRYDNFKATIASASILKKFYGVSQNTNVDNVQTMLTLYNDYQYINKVRDTEKQMDNTTDKDELDRLNKLLDAYKANIQNEDMQKVITKDA
ncbi:MAG: hypothetical protein AAF985_13870 [Bacteroidota bacterium]